MLPLLSAVISCLFPLLIYSFQAIDGSEVEAIRPLPWYPENLAWQSNYSRMQLRKNKTLERYIMNGIIVPSWNPFKWANIIFDV